MRRYRLAGAGVITEPDCNRETVRIIMTARALPCSGRPGRRRNTRHCLAGAPTDQHDEQITLPYVAQRD